MYQPPATSPRIGNTTTGQSAPPEHQYFRPRGWSRFLSRSFGTPAHLYPSSVSSPVANYVDSVRVSNLLFLAGNTAAPDGKFKGKISGLLVNLLGDAHSRAGEDGKHHFLIEAYGYRWFRVGGLDYLLKRSDIDVRSGRTHQLAMPDAPWWQSAVIYQIYPRSFQDINDDGVGEFDGSVLGDEGWAAVAKFGTDDPRKNTKAANRQQEELQFSTEDGDLRSDTAADVCGTARRTSVHHAYQGIQTREEISWHKVASGWIWSSQSVAVAITTTERRLPQNRLRNRARTSRSHSNRLGPGGRLSPP
jgi:hypothetical protein